MIRNIRLAVAALVALSTLACASAQAQVKPFKIRGSGVALTGLPLPGQDPREHTIVGNATHLGRYTGTGFVQTDTLPQPNPETGTLDGEFGGGSPYVFVAANGDELVTWYGRTDHDAAEPGIYQLTVVGGSQADPIVTARFVAEFVVQPDESTGKFAGVTGSWIMIAQTEPFHLFATDPVDYVWEGEGELTFPEGN
jgi:hypothetical protein